MTRSPAPAESRRSEFRLPVSPRVRVGFGLFLIASVSCYFFPPLRVVRLAPASDDQPSLGAATDPKAVGPKLSADQFWDSYLPAARGRAVSIQMLLDAIDSDPKQARDEFSRQVGLGDTYFYFVRGTGDIEEITRNKVILAIEGHQRRASIEIGMIVGNTVCDATGWAKVNQFADLQSFNDLSSELNRQIESEVLAPLRDRYQRGMRLEFIGCAQVSSNADLDPLVMVPVSLKIIAANEVE